MKTHISLALLLAAAVTAQAQQASDIFKGSDLLPTLLSAERVEVNRKLSAFIDEQNTWLAFEYISGVADAVPTHTCLPTDVSTRHQARRVVTDFYRTHPERMNEAAAALVIEALATKWCGNS